MGTAYIRDEAIPSSIEVEARGVIVLSVPHIRAEEDIGNVLAINLRQQEGTQLAFVSFAEETGFTDVLIDGSTLATGTEHVLVLESFNINSKGVESALKTDTVTITVVESEFIVEDNELFYE